MALNDLFQNLMQNPKMTDIARQLYGSMRPEGQQAFLGNKPSLGPILDPENFGTVIVNASDKLPNLGLKDFGSLALGAAKAHPFKTAGLIGLGAGNIGGLMDNNKFGGQLGGLALGGLGAATLASGNPYLQAVMTMGGGSLGALFDKLRARKEQEGQYQGYGR